ncbi:MAG TPA: tetratricopeptide repeat protein [Candidatus Edwardsbacteria bacterium]|nr:tetratricopeptide repeat protein [Candidatus Edwardsbacteria bacterium]
MTANGRWRQALLDRWHPYAWLAVLAAALYARTLFFGWSYFDDDHLVLANHQQLANLGNLLRAFATDVDWHSPGIYYRPVLTLSLMLDASWGGGAPPAYHLGNVLLHIAASCLVFRLFRLTGSRPGPALAWAAIFAAHPLCAQAVAWVPGRNDQLLCVFVLLAFIALLEFIERGQWRWFASGLASFALALLAKETALAFPLVALAWLLLAGHGRLNARSIAALVAGWIAVIIGYALLRQGVVPAGIAALNGCGEMLAGLAGYIGKLMLPVRLGVLPVPQDTSLIPGIAGLVMLALLLAARGVARITGTAFGACWLLLLLAPVAVRSTESAYFLEQRMYLPMIGGLLLLREARIFSWPGKRRVGAALLAAALALLSWRTLDHCSAFADDLSFWRNATATSPHSYFAHAVLGQRYAVRGQLDQAELELKRAAELRPQDARLWSDLGTVLLQQGKLEEATRALATAINIDPGQSAAHRGLGVVLLRRHELPRAETELNKALALDPGDAEACDRLALVYYLERRYGEAAEYHRRAVQNGMMADPRIDSLLAPHLRTKGIRGQ